MDIEKERNMMYKIQRKEDPDKAPKKKSMNQIFILNKNIKMKKELTDNQKKKLKEHSKFHKGGMQSLHMKNMVKFMKEGDSFTKAHNKAVKLDKKKPANKVGKMAKTKY